MRGLLWAVLALAPVLSLAPSLEGAETGRGHVTVVAFISARCPVSNAYGDRLEALYADYVARGVEFRFLNPNVNETDVETSENAKRHGYRFRVERDAMSELALKLGAEFTPEVYLLDKDGSVRYHGGIDDAQNPARVKTQGLRLALDAVLAGKTVAVPVTKAFGCTIKRPRGAN